MDKRVFSLTDKSRVIFLLLSSMWWIAWLGLNLTIGHRLHDPWRWYSSLSTLALLVLVYSAAMWAERVRYLEISDQGLMLRRWLLRPVSISWDLINSIKRSQEVQSFRLFRQYESAVIRDVAGQRIAVPSGCRNAAEIIEILKQRLPESVFVSR